MDEKLLSQLLEEDRLADFLFELRDGVKELTVSKVAKDAGVTREALYRSLDPCTTGTKFTTIANVIKACGYSLSVTKRSTTIDLSKYTRYSAALNEVLKSEYHPTRNRGRSINDESVISSRKVWWVCPKKHAWNESVRRRMKGASCPYCNAQNLLDSAVKD